MFKKLSFILLLGFILINLFCISFVKAVEVGSITNLRVTNTYYDSSPYTDPYRITWRWDTVWIPPSGSDYGFYTIWDEDGDQINAAEGPYYSEIWDKGADYPCSVDVCNGARVPFGPNETHCIKVQGHYCTGGECFEGPVSSQVCGTTVTGPPSPPTSVSAYGKDCGASSNANSVVFSWGSTTATQFKIYRKLSGGSYSGGLIATLDKALISSPYTYSDNSGIAQRTKYYYQVTGYNSTSGLESSGVEANTWSYNPNPTSAPSATDANQTYIDWDWSNYSQTLISEISGNYWYFMDDAGEGSCDQGTVTSECEEGLPAPGYSFPVSREYCVCQIGSGSICSGNSPTGTTGEGGSDPVVNSFSVDGNTLDFETCDTQLTIAWNVSDGEELDEVSVWRRTDGGGWIQREESIRDISGKLHSGSWVDSVACGHEYEYGIHVIDADGNEADEGDNGLSIIKATTICSASAPSNLTFSSIEQDAIRLNWTDNSSNELGFYIYRDYSTNRVWTNSADDTSKKIDGLLCGTEYDWWVSAYNICGESSKISGSESTASCSSEKDFILSVSPTSRTLAPGTEATYDISILSTSSGGSCNYLTGNITLTDIDCPSGATCTFDKNPLVLEDNGCSSDTDETVMRINGASNGTYDITVNGIGGNPSREHEQEVQLIVDSGYSESGELRVNYFDVNGNIEDFTTTDPSLEIPWTVSDTTSYSLDQAEVWYRQDEGLWTEIVSCRDTSITGNGPESGTCTHNVICGHDYEYGIHVTNTQPDMATETDSGLETITATVNCPNPGADPEADFSACRIGTSGYNLQFTNESTDADGDSLSYEWDFGDGSDLDYTTNPTHDYSGSVSGVSAYKIAQAENKKSDYGVEEMQGSGNWFIDLWNKIKDFFKNLFKSEEAEAAVSGWWNSNYDYRRQITVTAGTQNIPENYNAELIMDTASLIGAGKLKSDEKDFRIVFYDGVSWQELDRVIATGWNTATTEIWFPIIDAISAGADDDNYYVYYGYASESTDAPDDWDNVSPISADANTTAMWHMDEGSGTTLYDSSGNGYNATMYGTVNPIWRTDGKYKYAVWFDADDSNYAVTPSFITGVPFTVEGWVWIKNRNVGHLQMTFAKQYFTYFGMRETGSFFDAATNNNFVGTYAPAIRVWHHFAYTYDGTTQKFYMNGTLIDSDTTSYSSSSSNPFYFAGIPGQNYYFEGMLTEVRVSGIVRDSFPYAITDDPTCVLGDEEGYTGIQVSLTADDGYGGDIKIKTLDLDDMELDGVAIEDCALDYDLTNVTAANCQTVDLDWEEAVGPPASYTIYRSAISSSGPWTAIGTSATDYYEDDNLASSNYWYYVTTNSGLNNSTISPACSGGYQPVGQICPLSVTIPTCPVDATGLTITRQCGSFDISWDDVGVYAYRLLKCVNNSSTKCLSSSYFNNNNEVVYEGTATNYTDDEIITTNNSNPASSYYYCYKVITQDEEDGVWSATPTDNPVCNFSYCYRAPGWQEE